jgi:hypothetical protein
MRLRLYSLAFAVGATAFLFAADSSTTSKAKVAKAEPDPAEFEKNVKPVLAKSCAPCHNDRVSSGGLNIHPFSFPGSVTEQRDEWERILQKIRTGEMPPKGFPKPPEAQIATLLKFVQSEFERSDQAVKPDPGRVTARRLNRSEYSNTVRDLLGVDFRAEKDFPTDDSGHGFDNIGDVLTISPVLMEKYIMAAERIAARAIGADPMPKPLEAEYSNKSNSIRRPDFSSIEATHGIEWDGEYNVIIGLPGQRGPEGTPVQMGVWMDGTLLQTLSVETKPSKLVYFNPYSEEKLRLFLPEGDHTFRVGFINDDFVCRIDHLRWSVSVESGTRQSQEDPDLRAQFRIGMCE